MVTPVPTRRKPDHLPSLELCSQPSSPNCLLSLTGHHQKNVMQAPTRGRSVRKRPMLLLQSPYTLCPKLWRRSFRFIIKFAQAKLPNMLIELVARIIWMIQTRTCLHTQFLGSSTVAKVGNPLTSYEICDCFVCVVFANPNVSLLQKSLSRFWALPLTRLRRMGSMISSNSIRISQKKRFLMNS